MTVHARIEQPELALVPLAVDYAAYRRRVIFQCYKWDPQVGGTSTISDHACTISADAAAYLERTAESLAAETIALEKALLARPDLYPQLGLPRALQGVLSHCHRYADTSVRVMRFDFHPTAEGWALSEVNSDVPGGFSEASALPELAAGYVPNARAGRSPADAIVMAMSGLVRPGGSVGFVHATSYADDRQVMQFLASRFSAAGFRCALLAPDHLRWRDGRAVSIAQGTSTAIDAIVRFYPADWLPALARAAAWRNYFRAQTPCCNPARALLTQSKRLPLVWDALGVAVPAWRAALPETRDPRTAPWREDDNWLVKPAFGRVGEGIAWRGGVATKVWNRTKWRVRLQPRAFVAQKRFASQPLAGPDGPRHLCIGVFTVDGKAAGFYGRLSSRSTIEKHAQDIAILIRRESHDT